MTVSVRYGDQGLIAESYQAVYQDIINDLAYIKFKHENQYSEKHKNDLTNAAVKYLIKAEREEIKCFVDSDYDYFIDDDQGVLFDLLNCFYDKGSEAMEKAIGQRIIRNYEIKALRKIKLDVETAVEDIKEGKLFGRAE